MSEVAPIVQSCDNLGVMFEKGDGTAKDLSRAVGGTPTVRPTHMGAARPSRSSNATKARPRAAKRDGQFDPRRYALP
jgi:hypothetical protein